jgi:DNA-binding LacI/PurR family transcriptional regulator
MLYKRLVTAIRLAQKRYGDRALSKIRLKDVAEMAEVSRTTASMALNNYANISPATRDRVVHCARRLGYVRKQQRSRPLLASGAHKDTGTIAFIVCGHKSFDTNPYYASIISGAMRVAKVAQRKMVVCHWLPEEMDSLKIPDELTESTVTGAIMTGWCSKAAIDGILRAAVPLVTVDTNVVHTDCDSVGPDNHEAVRLAFGHLRALGHEKIVALLGNLKHVDWQKKRDAFVAMAAANAIPCITVSQPGCSSGEAWEEIRAQVPDVTAILATSDGDALGLLSALHAKGIHCPEDISVVGIDGMEAGNFSAPPLTTANTNQNGMGQLALLQLLERIAHPEAPIVRRMPKAELIKRASCRPLKN